MARRRLVFLTWRAEVTRDYWLLKDYFPVAARIDEQHAVPVDRLVSLLGDAIVEPVMVPHDCVDGFAAAYWRRPRAYLDAGARAGMSLFARLDDALLRPGLQRLADDLDSGRWRERHSDLIDREALDVGYCLVTASV